MLFNSVEFIWFFNAFMVGYFVSPKSWRPPLLLAASYFFYMVWNPIFVLLILASTLTDYFAALFIARTSNERSRSFALFLSLFLNLSILFFFKYYDFMAANLNSFMSLVGLKQSVPELNLLLPIGISFYTFQTMGYTIDVYRKKIPVEASFVTFSLYVSFFPQLVAGPIERAGRLIPQLKEPKDFCFERMSDGLRLALWGLLLKVGIADSIAPFVDQALNSPMKPGLPLAFSMYGFAIQLFCDFAGYSIIAIGLARVLGVQLSPNFNAPYLARNISDFWNRWHITLTQWFQDYVFRPLLFKFDKKFDFLGKTLFKQNVVFLAASMITTVLLGFWHGAEWGFGLFGLFHAIAVSGYHFSRRYWNKMPDAMQLILTFHIFTFSCIFFRLSTLSSIGEFVTQVTTSPGYLVQVIAVTSVCLVISDRLYRLWNGLKINFGNTYFRWSVVLIWCYGSLFLALTGGSYFSNPRQFIYFQF